MRAVLLALFILSAAFPEARAYDLPSSTGTHRVEFEADEASFNEYTRIIGLSGHVRLQEKDADNHVMKIIRAKEVSVDMNNKTVTSPSDFVIDSSTGSIYGRSGTVDYGKNKGTIKDARFTYGTFTFRGKEVSFDENRYVYRKASLTSCDAEPPHYRLKTSVIKIVPERYFLAYNCLLYLGKIPVFYFPVLYKPDGEGTPFTTYLFPGYDSRNGPYLKANFAYKINPETKVKVYLDYFSKKGIGTGGEFDFRRPEKNITNISAYRIRESGESFDRWALTGGYWHSFNNYNESASAHYYSQSYFRLLSDPQFNNHYFRSNPFAVSDDKYASVAFTRQSRYTITRLSARRRDIMPDDTAEDFIREEESSPRFDFFAVPFSIKGLPWLNSFSVYVESGREHAYEDYQKKGKAEWTVYKSIPLLRHITLAPSAFVSESMYLSTSTAMPDEWTGRYGGKVNLRLDQRWGSLDLGYAHTQRMRNSVWKDDLDSEDKGQERRGLYADLFIVPDYKTYFRARSGYDTRDYFSASAHDRIQPLVTEISYSPSAYSNFFAQDTYDFHGSSNSFIMQGRIGNRENYFGLGLSNYSSAGGDDGAWIFHNTFGIKFYPKATWRLEGILRMRTVADEGHNNSLRFFEKTVSLYKDFHDFRTRLSFRSRPGGVKDVFFIVTLKMNEPQKEDLEQKAKEYWRPWREDGADRDY